MFRIRKIFDDVQKRNRLALEQVRSILAARFQGLSQGRIDRIPDILRNPFEYDFRSILYIAEGPGGAVRGFALLSHDPTLGFCFLDYLATSTKLTGRGVGGALYERLREEALLLNVAGICFECLPDDPALCRDPLILRENIARLKFYEAFGAFPVAGTAYETPVHPGGDNPPYLVFDDLGQGAPLRRGHARAIVRAILERKYADVCGPEYVRTVVDSFRDDPVRLRPPRYEKVPADRCYPVSGRISAIALVVSDRHAAHHIHDRGYVESPVRIRSILDALERTNLFRRVLPFDFPERHLAAVHDPSYIRYFKRVCETLPPDGSVYPYVFPIRNQARPPVELAVRAGYYCIDTFTPLNRNAFVAAKRAVDCALTGASSILEGVRLAYALVRPPGHHAEPRAFGGFCYFNNAAAAAHYLSEFGTVAALDLDYHHGNGNQTIFYRRRDVLTLSIHAHPSLAYPYFSGFADERGEGEGAGCNGNYPLPEAVDGAAYRTVLEKVLARVRHFRPKFLVVCLGLDTARGDPTGTWSLRAQDFREMGARIGNLRLPTLVVQEGGYDNRSIGANARAFFEGLWSGTFLTNGGLRNGLPAKA